VENQEKREEVTRRKIDQMVAQAKEKMAKGDKKGALFAMKRKKLHDAELAKIENVKMTLVTQVINLESASQNKDTFIAMKEGKNAMAKIRDEVGIEKVDELMDDIREEMEQAQEISDAIAAPVDPLAADEDELLAELEQMGEWIDRCSNGITDFLCLFHFFPNVVHQFIYLLNSNLVPYLCHGILTLLHCNKCILVL
jgi:charged multivesicular body protein 4